MTIASGSRVRLSYVAESTHGTTPGSPSMKTLRTTGRNINLVKNMLESQEVRASRQLRDLRHGFQQGSGEIPFELSLSAYDDFLAAALGGSWAAISTSGVNLSADGTANTFTRASGSFVSDGYRAGDIVVTAGFSNSENNGRFRLTGVSATVLTVEETTPVTESAGSGKTVDLVGKRLDIGTTLTTFSVERAFLDLAQYQVFTGLAVNEFYLTLQPEQIVGGRFNVLAMAVAALSGSSLGSPSAAPTHDPFASFDGVMYEGGTQTAIATGLEMTLNNGRSLNPVIGAKTSPDVFEGTAKISGTLTAFFNSATLLNKFVNETASSLWFKLNDLNGTDFMNIVLGRVKYAGGEINPPQEGPAPISMPFRALEDDNGTSISIQRSNAS